MKNVILCICDDDEQYLSKLAKYITRQKNQPFIVKTYTSIQSIKANQRGPMLLLISSLMMNQQVQSLNCWKIIILSEGEIKAEFKSYLAIYKYQLAEYIYKLLIESYLERDDVSYQYAVNRKNTEIIGVYSPIHNDMAKEYMIQLCQKFGDTESVLLLSLEEFSIEEGKGMTELLYYLKGKKGDLALRIENIVLKNNNFDYIPPCISPLEITSILIEEWQELFNILRVGSRYEKVIIYFEKFPSTMDLLNLCDQIQIPYKDIGQQYQRVEKMKSFIKLSEREEIVEKLVEIKLV